MYNCCSGAREAFRCICIMIRHQIVGAKYVSTTGMVQTESLQVLSTTAHRANSHSAHNANSHGACMATRLAGICARLPSVAARPAINTCTASSLQWLTSVLSKFLPCWSQVHAQNGGLTSVLSTFLPCWSQVHALQSGGSCC